MIHYHGTPITPEKFLPCILRGGHAFVSHKYPQQLETILSVCQSFALDNGAFSAWRSGNPVKDWQEFYKFAETVGKLPSCDFVVIPDVIDGSEQDNDYMLTEFPLPKQVGSPVWHMHESFDRLERLCYSGYYKVCVGSSQEYASVGTKLWWERMSAAMDFICKDGLPPCKLHGLRMLNPKVFTKLPLHSADSCTIAVKVGIDNNWKGTLQPATKSARGLVLRDRIEAQQSSTKWGGAWVETEDNEDEYFC
jgi:hypothetical protein